MSRLTGIIFDVADAPDCLGRWPWIVAVPGKGSQASTGRDRPEAENSARSALDELINREITNG